jgi:hypothetical protein
MSLSYLRRTPISGAFLLASVLHFYSGQPPQNLTGVDTFAPDPASTSVLTWPARPLWS